MTDTAERIAKLAERLDPEPPQPNFFDHRVDRKTWDEWNVRRIQRHNALALIPTPGAQLGALVDLASHKLGPERAAKMLAWAAKGECDIQDILAALLAAMEEV